MFLKRNASHCCAIQNPRAQTLGLPKLCLVKQRKAMTCHLAPKIIPHLPQARTITKITEELILVFSLQGVFWLALCSLLLLLPFCLFALWFFFCPPPLTG